MKKKKITHVLNESNINAVFEQMKKFVEKERMKPAQVMRPCFKCKQIMLNQAYCVILNNGVPDFYCEACAPESL